MAKQLLIERQTGLVLSRDMTWRCPLGSHGLRLVCHEGAVWLTQEGDAEDHVVEAGEELWVGGSGLVVVQALRPARLSIQATPPSQSTLGREAPGWGALGAP